MKEALIAFVAALVIGAVLNGMGGLGFGSKPPDPPAQPPATGSTGSGSTPLTATTDSTFESDVLASKGLVFIDFYSPTCGPCKLLEPAVEQLASQYKDKVRFYKLDVDQSPKVCSQFNVTTIPTLMIFKDGHRVDSYTGVMPQSDLAQAITRQL